MNKSHIVGIMIRHTDNDLEFYNPHLSKEDEDIIYDILDKYGDNHESKRGELAVIDLDYANFT